MSIDSAWILPAVLFGIVTALLLSWSYLRVATAPLPVRLAAFACKTAAILLLLLCLLNPLRIRSQPEKQANYFLILTDESSSMARAPKKEVPSPIERVRELQGGPTESLWLEQLREDFRVREFSFSEALSLDAPERPLSESNLGLALSRLREQFADLPVAGILLFSDGVLTDELPPLPGSPPIYPVDLLPENAPRDLAVQSVRSDQSPFEDAAIEIEAEIVASRFRGRPLKVTLSDENGKILETRTIEPPSDLYAEWLKFETKPYRLGPQFFRVEVAPLEPREGDDALAENNQREVVINRRANPYRVLYVAGRPNWEHKFLQRALSEDQQVQLVSLLRIARREPKFEFRGDGSGASGGNPLFRGFDEEDEATRFDEPVFVRLNVRSSNELENGMPSLEEELYAYDAIILDDIEAEFFGPEAAELVDGFVRERGGALLMLGGRESFADGGYADTPIGDLLPVTLAGGGLSANPASVRFGYSREGLLQPWMRLRANKADEEARLAEMRALRVLNESGSVRPGASLFAVVEDDSGVRAPAVVGHRIGHGRVAAILVGDLWRWGLVDGGAAADRDQFWRQLLRWMVSETPARLEVRATERAASGPGRAIEATIGVRNAEFEPDSGAEVAVSVRGPDGSTRSIPAQIDFEEAGKFRATLPGLTDGRYVVNVTAEDEGEIITEQTGVLIDTAGAEFRRPGGNRELLEQLAAQTGGEKVAPADLRAFVESLQERVAPVMTTVSQPLWHQAWIFLAALSLLAAEWTLRRRNGLP